MFQYLKLFRRNSRSVMERQTDGRTDILIARPPLNTLCSRKRYQWQK